MRGEPSSEALAQLFDPQFELHWHDQRTYGGGEPPPVAALGKGVICAARA